MVGTRGGHRYRPKVQTRTLTRDGAGISRAAAGHSTAQDIEAPPALTPDAAVIQSPAPAAIPKEPQGSEPPPRRYQTRVGPRLASPVHPRPPQRARLPSEPEHLARGSLCSLSPSLRLFQLIRVHHPSYPHIRGSRVRCLAGIRSQGT